MVRIETQVRASEGFEALYDELQAMKLDLDNRKEVAKAEALAKVDEQFAVQAAKIDNLLAGVSETYEVEVEIPDDATEYPAAEVAEEPVE